MGVAPPPDQQLEDGRPLGVVSTGPPNVNGGNMDNRHMCEGSTAYYPIFVPGALFSCGDGHAAQGDGEVSGESHFQDLRLLCELPEFHGYAVQDSANIVVEHKCHPKQVLRSRQRCTAQCD